MKDLRDVVVLVVIALVAGTCLSLVHTSTKDRISEMKRRELENAIQRVEPFMKDPYKEIRYPYEDDTVTVYLISDTETIKGAAVKMRSSAGFSGDISFLMGINKDEEITGFYLLDHKETPGLGSKVGDEVFWGQFIGKSLDQFVFKVKKEKGQVDAITAATITSKAVTHALAKGLRIFRQFKADQELK